MTWRRRARRSGIYAGETVGIAVIGSGNTVTQIPLAPVKAEWPVVSNRIPRSAGCFQQRGELDTVTTALASSGTPRCQVLVGMGGVGKTQAAAYLARTAIDAGHVDLVVWASAADRASVVAEYARAAAAVGLQVHGDADADAARLCAWLESTRRRWVVVLDDVADPDDLDGLWPPETACGRILVTTRLRHDTLIGRGPHTVLAGFARERSTAYLAERLAAARRIIPGDADLDGLADDLGDLPLALAQAVAFIVHEGLEVAAYRRLLADRTRRLADSFPRQGLPDEQALALPALWSLSLERADRSTPNGIGGPILELIGLLDPNGVPTCVLGSQAVRRYLAFRTQYRPRAAAWCYAATRAAHVATRIEQLVATVDEVDAAVRVLDLLNLVTHDLATDTVTVHQLVQRAALDRSCQGLKPAAAAHRRHMAAVAAADALNDVWPSIEHDAPFVERLRSNIAVLHSGTAEDLWNVRSFRGKPEGHPVLFRRAASLGQAGQYAAAVDTTAGLCAESLRYLGPDHPRTLTARNNLAYWQDKAGDSADAVVGFEAVVADRLRTLGPVHPDTIATRHNLAHSRGRAGDPVAAVADLEALLDDELQVLGPDHRDTLVTRHILALWRNTAGNPAGAVTDLTALLADDLRVLGPDHPDTLATRNNLALWRGHAGDTVSVVGDLEAVLADRLRVLGPDHPDILAARNHVADWRGKTGDAAGAAADFEALLADRLRLLGPDHMDTLDTRDSLAHWRAHAGDPAGAAADFEALLDDELRVLGPDHPITLATRRNLAHCRGLTGRRGRRSSRS